MSIFIFHILYCQLYIRLGIRTWSNDCHSSCFVDSYALFRRCQTEHYFGMLGSLDFQQQPSLLHDSQRIRFSKYQSPSGSCPSNCFQIIITTTLRKNIHLIGQMISLQKGPEITQDENWQKAKRSLFKKINPTYFHGGCKTSDVPLRHVLQGAQSNKDQYFDIKKQTLRSSDFKLYI